MAREASEQAVLCANAGALLALDPNLEDLRHAGGNRTCSWIDNDPHARFLALIALRACKRPVAAKLGRPQPRWPGIGIAAHVAA